MGEKLFEGDQNDKKSQKQEIKNWKICLLA